MLTEKVRKNRFYIAIERFKSIFKDFKPLDIPREVMLELTDRCNIDCEFCFNKLSVLRRGEGKELTTKEWKGVINKISKASVPVVRFTGGEPLIREDIFELMEYACSKGLKVWLNTNATLITRGNVYRIAKYVENILIPLNAYDVKGEYEVTGYRYFKKKLKGIRLLKKHGIKYLRCGTVATKSNINNLERIQALVKRLDISDWELFREVPLFAQSQEVGRSDIAMLVEKLLTINKRENKNYKVANALPFCVYAPEKVKKVALGAIADDGHMRFVIDAFGRGKPMYYLDENIGYGLQTGIYKMWNSKFMRNMRNLKFVPDVCKKCQYLKICRGGSRFVAKSVYGRYTRSDPLAQSERVIIA